MRSVTDPRIKEEGKKMEEKCFWNEKKMEEHVLYKECLQSSVREGARTIRKEKTGLNPNA